MLVRTSPLGMGNTIPAERNRACMQCVLFPLSLCDMDVYSPRIERTRFVKVNNYFYYRFPKHILQ